VNAWQHTNTTGIGKQLWDVSIKVLTGALAHALSRRALYGR
jgi:hypothetical protein